MTLWKRFFSEWFEDGNFLFLKNEWMPSPYAKFLNLNHLNIGPMYGCHKYFIYLIQCKLRKYTNFNSTAIDHTFKEKPPSTPSLFRLSWNRLGWYEESNNYSLFQSVEKLHYNRTFFWAGITDVIFPTRDDFIKFISHNRGLP